MRSALNLPIIKHVARILPQDITNRYRLLIMLLAMSSTFTIWPTILSEQGTAFPLRILQIALLTAIFWRWSRWYRNGSVRQTDLVLELPAVFVIALLLAESPAVLTFVYTGVYFRPLFTNNRDTLVASAGYVLAYITGMAVGAAQFGGEFGAATVVQAGSLLMGAAIVRTIAIILERSASMTRGLEQAERQYRTLVEQLPGIVITFDDSGAAQYVSPRIKEILGYNPAEFIRNAWSHFRIVHADDKRRVIATLDRYLKTREPFAFECRVYHANGELRWIRFEANLFEAGADPRDEWRGIITDISEQHQLAARLEHQAFHDALTDLPNRALFEARLKHTIDMQSRRTSLHAVLFLDLDNFKIVNDSLGHAAGDQLLITAAERIQGCLRSGDTVARLGGDEFAILLEDLNSHSEAVTIAERIGHQLSVVFHLDGYPAYVSSSIGIAFNDSSTTTTPDLVRQADVAMYEAKHAGKARYVIFQPDMEHRAWTRLHSETELREAFEREEFFVCYQPVVDLETGAITELEALVRWNHPERGVLEPDQFLPIAEEIGVMATLDTWVLQQACRQTVTWHQQFPAYADLVVSVNMSPALLQQPTLASIVEEALADSGLLPRHLRLEVTEDTMFDDIERALEAINELHSVGVQIAIDDFGTGNSALSFLRRLPVDTLKIDRTYVSDMQGNPDGLKMMTAVIGLAKSMGLTVTVEGIEHRNQTHLHTLGCDRGQGFYFSRPLPGDLLENLLETGESYLDRLAGTEHLQAGPRDVSAMLCAAGNDRY